MAAEAARLDLERLAEICERYGVAELSLFGSAARGEVRPSSDVDVLYVVAAGCAAEMEDRNAVR
jgi:predicted nucleotidyltransferase